MSYVHDLAMKQASNPPLAQEPRRKGNPSPSERYAGITVNYPTLDRNEQGKVREVMSTNVMPFMLSQLSQEQILDITRLAMQKLAPENLAKIIPAQVSAPKESLEVTSRTFFAIPLSESNFTAHKENLKVLQQHLASIKEVLVANTKESSSNTNLVGTDLANTVISNNGVMAIKSFKLEYNAALKVFRDMHSGIQKTADEIEQLDQFCQALSNTVAEKKQQLTIISEEIAIEQQNFQTEIEKSDTMVATLLGRFSLGYKGAFPSINPQEVQPKSIAAVSSENFTQHLNKINGLFNEIQRALFGDVLSQLCLSTAPRHFINKLPNYRKDQDFEQVAERSKRNYDDVHKLLQTHFSDLCDAEIIVKNTNTQLKSELNVLKNNYEALASELEKGFAIYKNAVIELCKNMKSNDEIRGLTVDAKEYDIK